MQKIIFLIVINEKKLLRKIFLKEIKILFLYFIRFNKDRSILFKKYLENCKIVTSNQKLIIIITNDKNIFSANNKC